MMLGMADYTTTAVVPSRSVQQALRQLARNGRWGTCGDCPRDSGGETYPEFCIETMRYDHRLSATAAFEQFKYDYDRQIERRGR